ncbi:antitoxin MazE [Bacillus thermophilus]|uniref:Antitoxin MazE n=1 Tax=Siminovitchia thermophila TaxID=1245522 RepID=A0ABS2RC06_9BACI|nr:AbrB/MazE/SpoVT family DNA-binding domain-containing protein [Siminovitchia thermophila]MBM7717186.1 antitoxin MazE [Siminovitchia thermophila]
MNANNEKEVFQLTAKVQKWGNSLGVRIPQKIANKIGFFDGSEIKMIVEDQAVILKRASEKPTLEELLSGITEENRHDEIEFGTAGSELI